MTERFPRRGEGGEGEEISRRNFLFGAGSALGIGALSYKLWRDYHDEQRESYAPELSIEPAPRPKQEVEDNPTEAFMAEVAGYEAQSYLRHDEVLFVDDAGAPIGAPIPLEPIDGVDPGEKDEHGLFIHGVSGSWLRAARERLQEEYPEASFTIDPDRYLPRQMNMTATIARALELGADEPDLVAAIKAGEVVSYVDIVRYFADKPVVGAAEHTRAAYVREEIEFGSHVSASMEQPLRDLMPGVCMQESGFNNAVVSPVGARGIFQFMPNVWSQDYERSDADYNSLKIQTETAGEHFSRIVHQLTYFAGADKLQVLRAHCEDDRQYEQEVLIPLMINAYNAGGRRMGEAIAQFLNTHEREDRLHELSSGYGLFKQISDFAYHADDGVLAEYGVEARPYVMQVVARARVLAREYEYQS